jgi:UDP-glucose 4-epimerase
LKVLITGGAGFVGSTIGSALLDRGLTPVILDNLSTGRREYTSGRIFYQGDVSDGVMIDKIFAQHPDISATVHCAGLIVVPESVAQPLRYYRENVSKTVDLIGHLLRNKCRRFVFSSTAALYAPGVGFAVDENSPLAPSSPYAQTKAIVETILADAARTGGLKAVALRYFNPIGADPLMRTGLQSPNASHVLGKMIRAWETEEIFQITGVDWQTRDGTTIRDYVHVWDLALAHVAALLRFDDVVASTPHGFRVINLGSGRGTTVREFLTAFCATTGKTLAHREAERRPGDIVGSFTHTTLARELLDWAPTLGIEDGIRHALHWRSLGSSQDLVLDGEYGSVRAGRPAMFESQS